ncbi:hypothetical protein WISP_65027 [Willisornis vidua]|uniref:ribonuclease H n=1 Tax=Willisornis vidua TaxID=1566151 RepID=A0ABQ9D9R4_9PASS|nr:hypothetical protein WISP_65027 [Willisornis vidua]
MPATIIYRFMDDILLCQEKPFPAGIAETLTTQLRQKGLVVAPEKIQTQAPWTYLGWQITHSIIKPQKMKILSSVRTLNDAQRLVGEFQWIRSMVGLTNTDIHLFLPLLRGTQPDEPVAWTDEHAKALQSMAEKLAMNHANRRSASHPLGVWVCNHPSFPFALLLQDFNWSKENAHRSQRRCEAKEIAILEWMFPPHTAPKSIW